MKLEFFFLTYKFCVNIDKNTGIKVKQFWKDFLERNYQFDVEKIWNIEFHRGTPKTQIDYNNRILKHYHNSVCDLTEFNNFFRETIVKLSAMDGILWLHCSSFNLNNITYLVLGKKGYGKTTLLLNTLIKCGATFISNDQLPVFIIENNVYCISWRPDIKIQSNKNEKTLYLVNNKIPYSFINYENMSTRLKKKVVAPVSELNIKTKYNHIFKIDRILVLSNRKSITSFDDDFMKYVIDDSETIMPFKLENISRYMPYWNKRILKINMSSDAVKIADKCIDILNSQTFKFLIGNRIDFDLIRKKILLEENKDE